MNQNDSNAKNPKTPKVLTFPIWIIDPRIRPENPISELDDSWSLSSKKKGKEEEDYYLETKQETWRSRVYRCFVCFRFKSKWEIDGFFGRSKKKNLDYSENEKRRGGGGGGGHVFVGIDESH